MAQKNNETKFLDLKKKLMKLHFQNKEDYHLTKLSEDY